MIVLITQLRDCLISTVSLEYLRARQRWSWDGVNGKEKALKKEAVTKREIRTFYSAQRSVLRLPGGRHVCHSLFFHFQVSSASYVLLSESHWF